MWSALVEHTANLKQQHLMDLFAADPQRADRYLIESSGIALDYSKNFFTPETEQLLIQLAEASNVASLTQQMFNGAALNNTEQRPALHTLLRSGNAPDGLEAEYAEVTATLERIEAISGALRQGDWLGCSGKPIRQVVHLGIGGSYLGPKMVDEALAAQRNEQDIPCHYVANVDAHHLDQVLRGLDPEETLVIIVSKSFTTLETKANAEMARTWLLGAMPEQALSAHLIAVSSNIEAAVKFGIDKTNILPMWDWVGGRYTLGTCLSQRDVSALFCR